MASLVDVGSRTHRTAFTCPRRCFRRPCGVTSDYPFADTLGHNELAGATPALGTRSDGEVRPLRPSTPCCSREGAWAQRARTEPPFVRQAESASSLGRRPSSSACGPVATSCVQAGRHVLCRRGSNACGYPAALAKPTSRHCRSAPSQPQGCSPLDSEIRSRSFRNCVCTPAAPADTHTPLLGRALA